MAWKISKAKRQALVKLQLRDKKGRWIEMGGGVKWYSSRLKKMVAGTVVGTKGENALVRLNKENPTHEPALVSVPARSITVVDSKASLAPNSKMGTPTDKTSSFEKPLAVANESNGAPKSNGYVKPSDSPEDYKVSETADGRAYIGRADGAELYFPARSLEVGDILMAPNGGDETKPFSIGKGWAKKGVESVNTNGPKTGTVLRIEGDRYAVVQLPDGFTVEDKKHPGEQTDLVTVGLSNSVIKLTDGMQAALGDHISATFDGNGEDQEVDDSEEEQSDHVGREVPEDQLAEEEKDAADVDLTDITDGEEEEKAAPITEKAREIDVPQADNSGSDDQSLNENGLTDDEQKLVKAYDRMAQRAYDQGNMENGATYEANANRLRKLGEDRRAGAKADEGNPTDTPVKDPQNAPKAEKAPEPALDEEKPVSDDEKRYNATQDELHKVRYPGEDEHGEGIQGDLNDPRIKAAEDADGNAQDSVDQGQVKPDTPEWFDIWNSTYASSLEDQKAEEDQRKRQEAEDAETARLEAEDAAQQAPTANVSLDDLEAQAKADGDTVLYHGGLPEGTTLDGIDLNRNGSQQNKRGRSFGGFYLTDESSKAWSDDYAMKRNGVMHGFAIDKNARIDDRGNQQIDRLSAEDRAKAAETADVIKGKDLLGRSQYVILNKDVVKGVGETNLNEDKSSDESPAAPEAPNLEEPDAPVSAEKSYNDNGLTDAEQAKLDDLNKKIGEAARASNRGEKRDAKVYLDMMDERDKLTELGSSRAKPEIEEEPVFEGTEPSASGLYTRGFQWLTPAVLNSLPDGTTLYAPAKGGSGFTKTSNILDTAKKENGKWYVPDGLKNGERTWAEVQDVKSLKNMNVHSTPWVSDAHYELFDDNLNGLNTGDRIKLADGQTGVFAPRKNGAAAFFGDKTGKHHSILFNNPVNKVAKYNSKGDDRFLNGYYIRKDSQLGTVKKDYYEDDYSVTSTSHDLIAALPVGSSIATTDPERSDAGFEIVKVAPDVWAHPKRWSDRGWTILSDSDMVEYDVEQGIKLPGNPKLEPLSQRELDSIEISRRQHEEDLARMRQGLQDGAREIRGEQAPEPAAEPEAVPEAAPTPAEESPEDAPEAANAPEAAPAISAEKYAEAERNWDRDQAENDRIADEDHPGKDKPTLYTTTLRGYLKSELEFFDETSSESGFDQGYRLNGSKIEVYDFDRALASLDDYMDIEADKADGEGPEANKSGRALAGLQKLVQKISAEKKDHDVAVQDEDSTATPDASPEVAPEAPQEAPQDVVDAPEAPTEAPEATPVVDGEPDPAVVSHLNENAVLGDNAERHAAGLYLGGARYNAALREGKVPEMLQEQIDALTGFIDKQPEFGQETKLYRGVSSQFLPDAENRVGETITEPAFTSTSLKRSEAEIFAGTGGGLLMEITARPTDRALSINGARMEDQSSIPEEYRKSLDVTEREAEMLLRPNTSFEITGVSDRDGRKVVEARIVDTPENAPVESLGDEEASSEATTSGESSAAVYTAGKVSFDAAKEALNDQIEAYGDRAGLRLLPDGTVEVTDLDLAQQSLDRARGALNNRYVTGRATPEAADLRNAWLQVGGLYTKVQTESGERSRAEGTKEKTVDISPEDQQEFDRIQKVMQDAAVSGDMEAFKKATDDLAKVMDDVNKKNSGTYVPENDSEQSSPELDENGLTPEEARQLEIAREEDYLGGIADQDPESREYYQKPIDDLLEKGRQRLNPTPEEQEQLDELDKAMDDAVASDDVEAYDAASDAKTDLEEEIASRPAEESAPEPEEAVSESTEESEDSGVHPLDALGIQRRTPEAIAGESYPPTQQQQDVIDAVLGGLDTKVQAMAGTGKTSTLVALSRRIAEQGGQAVYIAFNKTVQEEAVRRMEGLPVEPKTGHAVAHTWATKNMPHLTVRLGGNDPTRVTAKYKNGKPKAYAKKKAWTSANAVGDALGIKAGDVKEESGIPKSKSNIVLAVKKTVEKFALSDSDTIQTSHVPEVFEIAESDLPKIVDFANDYWEDLKREDGNFRVTHDIYRKFWALSKPDLTDGTGGNKKGANILYIDEAQDTPPVLAKVVADQKMQKVIVGDANQAIYAFAENIDYLSEADGDIELPLNKSWRFGPEVADAGNRFLQMLGSENRVVGGGGPSKVTYDMENADAVLVRSNAGMIHAILEETKRDRRVTAPVGTRSNLESLVESVEALKAGYEPENPHDDLIGFKNWDQVKAAYNAGDSNVRMIVKLFDVVDNYSLSRMKPEDIEKEVERKMADAKKAIDHLVIDVPGYNTVKMVQDGDRTYLEPVDENPYPVDPKTGKQKEWGWKEKQYAVKNFSQQLGLIRKPWLKDNNLDFGPQMEKYRREGGLETVGWQWERGKTFTDDPEVVQRFKTYSGESDVTVSTAHKSKGLEWDRVRIGWDFIGPYEHPKTGEMIWPKDDEYKLGYVALTRAAKEIDPGSLDYVFAYTQENGGDPKAGKGNVTVPQDSAPEPEQIADEAPVDVTPDTEKEADDALVFADPEFTPVPETREAPEVTPEPEAEEAPEEVTPEVAPEEAPVYDDLTGMTDEEEAYKDSLIEQAKQFSRNKDWTNHKRVVKEYNAMFDKGRERLKLQKQQNKAEEVAPEPVATPEPEYNPAVGIVPEPLYDDDGLTREEAARVANLEKWINDVYKGYGQGNVKKMENELDDLYKRGEKRRNGEPDAEAPIDTTPEFETPAPVSLNPEVEPEAPSPVDGVPVVKPMKKSVPTGRRRGQSTVPDADGSDIKVGDTIRHKKFGDVVVTGVLPGAGRITFMHPTTGKESSVKGDAVSLSKETPPTIAEAVGATVTGTPGDRLMDPVTGKKAFIGADGVMIVTGERVRDLKTGQIGTVQTVYTGADKKASVPILFDGEKEPRRVRGTQLAHAGGGSDAPETAPLIPEAPEPAPEAPKAPEPAPALPEPTPEPEVTPEVAPAPVADDEKTARRRAAIGNAPEGAEVRSKDGGEVYTKITSDVWENMDQTDSFTDDEVLEKILNGEGDGKGYIIRTPRPEVDPEPTPEPAPEPEPEPEVISEPDTSLSGQALADTITYESTLHMTDGDLAEMMSRYADDPIVFDKIMEVMDERDANVFLPVDTDRTGATLEEQPALFDIPEPVAKVAAAKSQKKLTPQQKASEEYQNYVMAQYFRAAEELNGVLLNEAGKAHFNKDLAVDIFSGSVSVAHKYASEELLQWWRENGRETLASFRFGMYGWEQDRKAAQTARNLGYQRGSRDRDRSNF